MPLGGLESQPTLHTSSHSWRTKTEDPARRKATRTLEELSACFCCSLSRARHKYLFQTNCRRAVLKKKKNQNNHSKTERKGWVLWNKLGTEEQGEEAASPSGSALLLSKLFVVVDYFSVSGFFFFFFFLIVSYHFCFSLYAWKMLPLEK